MSETEAQDSRRLPLWAKILIILLLVYAAIVTIFESLLGYYQPQNQGTIVITTYSGEGTGHDRVVTPIEFEDRLYVRVNHWPRAWYWRLLDNPEVEVLWKEERGQYLAVDVDSEEFDRVNSASPAGLVFRILTGFPPRHIIRFDPR